MSDEGYREIEIAPNVTITVAKVVTSLEMKVIRENGTVEEIGTWRSSTPPPARD
jgi:hypothetical protein